MAHFSHSLFLVSDSFFVPELMLLQVEVKDQGVWRLEILLYTF